MAYPTDNKWNSIISQPTHWFETRVIINGVAYSQDKIMSMQIDWRMFAEEYPTVGSCLSGEISLKMLKPNVSIPRMASICPQVRVCNGYTAADQSDWIPQGFFFIDTREESKNDDNLPVISFHGYDSMLKSEAMYPSTEGVWPKTDYAVAEQIADTIGVDIDERTADVMVHGYNISPPISYTMREVLSNIAAMYAGNWIMTMEGKLLLVTLNGIPEDTSILVTGSGDIITFGELDGEELSISLVNTAV